MLVDVKKVPAFLDTLQKSTFKFTLTGSRYIGGKHRLSDWDFVAKNTRTLRIFLTKNGFEPLVSKVDGTLDGYTDVIYQKGKVQVQLSGYPEAKLFARDVIKTYFKKQHLRMESGSRREFWRMLCDAYRAGKDGRFTVVRDAVGKPY